MATGVATALLDAAASDGLGGRMGLFEVDEAWAAQVVEATQPRVLLLANLFRDQLDRYGELESLADAWQQMIATLPHQTRVVLNADDPLLAGLASGRPGTIHFGVEDVSQADTHLRHAADSKFCRICGSALVYSAVQLGHLGIFDCPGCDFTRPRPSVAVSAIDSHGMRGSDLTIATPAGPLEAHLPIPGLYNVYNAVAAAAVAHALSIPAPRIAAGLSSAKAVFGRVETIELSGLSVALMLIKNPVGANEVLRTITQDAGSLDLWIALNDKIADGRDISWVWDADFEMLAGRLRRVTCSGTRAQEMALRLAYAGVPRELIVIDQAVERSFDAAVDAAAGASSDLFALPTYTALLELRTAIAKRGDAPAYWGGR